MTKLLLPLLTLLLFTQCQSGKQRQLEEDLLLTVLKNQSLKQEDLNENDLNKVSSILGKSSSDVNKFLKKYKLDADDLLDVIETGGRRYSLAIMAAMKGNRRALRQLDDLLGFL